MEGTLQARTSATARSGFEHSQCPRLDSCEPHLTIKCDAVVQPFRPTDVHRVVQPYGNEFEQDSRKHPGGGAERNVERELSDIVL